MEHGMTGGSELGALIVLAVWLVFVLLMIVSLWKIFTKAGQPGWAAIIPIYNLVIVLKIAGRPIWWILLCLIPLVNLAIGVIVNLDIAKKFGKGAGYAIGLLLLPFIFMPMLAFGDAKYEG